MDHRPILQEGAVLIARPLTANNSSSKSGPGAASFELEDRFEKARRQGKAVSRWIVYRYSSEPPSKAREQVESRARKRFAATDGSREETRPREKT